ncbi:hypothetical protein [Naasia aerilata]|uniref:Uncharacterized protein n=1 Tax=Naasia aerilata TaxID=1162966 RepID=A0ABN6XM69_9MICO|nr:hypothetical protein [Naasia aerilata]BDZ46062.1 hypothetical protein GCM10025866_19710 [Naasia aerilata]
MTVTQGASAPPELSAAPDKGLWHYLSRGIGWGLLSVVLLLGIVVVGVPAVTGSTP